MANARVPTYPPPCPLGPPPEIPPPRPPGRRRSLRDLRRLLPLLSLASALALFGGCSNHIPGPYIDPPLPDGGPASDMDAPDRTGTLFLSPGPQELLTTDGTLASFSWRAFFRY